MVGCEHVIYIYIYLGIFERGNVYDPCWTLFSFNYVKMYDNKQITNNYVIHLLNEINTWCPHHTLNSNTEVWPPRKSENWSLKNVSRAILCQSYWFISHLWGMVILGQISYHDPWELFTDTWNYCQFHPYCGMAKSVKLTKCIINPLVYISYAVHNNRFSL